MSAVISRCGHYRYRLDREWNLPLVADGKPSRLLLWIMLNPSTADAERNDPTIRRCIGYSKGWGYDGLMVGNLFAWRATAPAELFAAAKDLDIVGPDNDVHLSGMIAAASGIVCAWGGNASRFMGRVADVVTLLATHARVEPCMLGATVGAPSQPVHPLYQPLTARPIPLDVGVRRS